MSGFSSSVFMYVKNASSVGTFNERSGYICREFEESAGWYPKKILGQTAIVQE